AKPSAKALFEQRKNYTRKEATSEVTEYEVDHLASFPVDRKGGVLSVQDGIRKLKLLDARGKIWAQRILLSVDAKLIKLLDCSENELEQFAMSSVMHLETNTDIPTFPSILALVVKEQDQKNSSLHYFQCSQVPAEVIGADIQSACKDFKRKKGHKSRPETLRANRDTIQASMRRAPSQLDINVKERVAAWTTTIEAQITSPRALSSSQQENSAEMMAFKVHRDVQMLNHALDDIEMFVAMIQKAAEAQQEISARQKSRSSKRSSSKRGKKESGLGMLELRSRLPPEPEFVDVLQKFKFCFNLLSKLRNHIRNPSAIEIVHFIFQPLLIVIQASKDLAQTVQCPLLTREAIDFLNNCMDANEAHILRQLGHYWTMSKHEFPKDVYFAPYVPQFKSGWEPPLPFMDTGASELAAYIAEQADHVQRKEEKWKANGANVSFNLPTNGNEATSAFKQHPKRRHTEKKSKPFFTVRNQAAQHGGTPQNKERILCRAMQDFVARNEHELSVKLDDLLDVLDDSKVWWKVKNQDGDSGYVPSGQMLVISSATKSPPHSNAPSSPPQTPRSSLVNKLYYIFTRAFCAGVPPPPTPPPPPPPLAPPIAPPLNNMQPRIHPGKLDLALSSVVLKKAAPRESPRLNSSSDLHEELRQRVSSQKPRNFKLPKKTGELISMILSKESSVEDVKSWLSSHGFSSLTIDSLSVLDGAQIFSLTKDELKMICDEEGSRVHSQLLVQKSMLSSASNGVSELDKIMQRRRQDL
uniref:SH3 domain-containing protein n=1 Tax=Ciona savignyi TaxID=51511 RepID=H2ZNP1_CIOSA